MSVSRSAPAIADGEAAAETVEVEEHVALVHELEGAVGGTGSGRHGDGTGRDACRHLEGNVFTVIDGELRHFGAGHRHLLDIHEVLADDGDRLAFLRPLIGHGKDLRNRRKHLEVILHAFTFLVVKIQLVGDFRGLGVGN